MAPTRTRWTLMSGLAFGLSLGAGWAAAQDANAVDAVGAPDGEGSVEVERRASVTPEEQVAEAERALRQGQDLSRRISGVLAEARQDGDIIRVTCVDDKLTQINANLRTLEQRVQNLRDAVESDDRSRSGHEYTVVTVLSQKFQVLSREANQCVGQDLYETGSTVVESTVDANAPTEDPALVVDAPPFSVPMFVPPGSGVS